MTDKRIVDLSKALARQSGATGLSMESAKILSWDPETLTGTLSYQGTVLEDLPLLSAIDAFSWQPGDEVTLLSWHPTDGHRRDGFGSYMILGRVFRPGAANAAKVLQALQTSFVTEIIDEIVTGILASPAGEDLVKFVIGSSVFAATVSTSQSTSSTSFTDLSTAGPTVSNVPISSTGRALVMVTAATNATSANGSPTFGQNAEMSYAISGATTRAASADDALRFSHVDLDATSFGSIRATATSLETGLNEGDHTFTAKYRRQAGEGSVQFADRQIAVIAF